MQVMGARPGCGFFVAPRLIVTCAHVVGRHLADGATVELRRWDHLGVHSLPPAKIIGVFPNDDLALVETTHESTSFAPLGAEACLNDTLVGIGFPIRPNREEFDQFVVSYEGQTQFLDASGRAGIESKFKMGQVEYGFSGGPLLNLRTGCVMGVVVATRDRNADLGGWAIDVRVLTTLLERRHIRLPPVDVGWNEAKAKQVSDSGRLKLQHFHPLLLDKYISTVCAYCVRLPYLSLHSIPPHRQLDDVYVNLRARGRSDEAHGSRIDSRPNKPSDYISIKPYSPAEILGLFSDSPIVVIGEPGTGKSTLLRHLALHSWTTPNKIGLKERHLPVLVRLPDLVRTKGAMLEKISQTLRNQLALDLDDTFLSSFVEQTQAPILLLFDALDEVPINDRPRIVDLLAVWLRGCRPHVAIITTRPAGYISGVFGKNEHEESFCKEFDLLPFSAEQTEEFALRWFAERKVEFLRSFDALCPMELRGTPLLLTIAAKVYASEECLPERRSSLYERFVSIWLEEAVYKDLEIELQEKRLSRIVRHVLSEIAAFDVESGVVRDAHRLVAHVTQYLRGTLSMSYDEAEANARTLLSVLSRRSGVLIQHYARYEFIHPTFKEYLAAESIVRGAESNVSRVFQQLEAKGLNGSWREVALFALGILSDREIDVTYRLARLLAKFVKCQKDEDLYNVVDAYDNFLTFVVAAVSDGAKVRSTLVNRLVTCLCAELGSSRHYSDHDLDPILALANLSRRSERALSELRRIVKDDNIYGYSRFRAMEYLINVEGLSASNLATSLAWGIGAEDLYGDSESNILQRRDIADIFRAQGYKELANKIEISVLLDERIDTDMIMELELPERVFLKREYEQGPEKCSELTLAEGKGTSELATKLISLAFGLSDEQAIARLVSNKQFMLTYLRPILAKYKFLASDAVEAALRAVALGEGDDWHRAECAVTLVEFFSDSRTAKKLLRDADIYVYGLNDSYAIHYLKTECSRLC